MNSIEKARELFQNLEESRRGRAVEIARRSFFIQQRLAESRN